MITKNRKNRKIYLYYTLLFFVLCMFCFAGHVFSRRSFIDTGDGLRQHYKALMYYGKYLRGILKNLLVHHRLIIPNWDFSFGEGADILQVLHYYVIGDPFTVLSVFVPARFTHYLYTFIVLLKIYCAGLSFIWLCRYTDPGHEETGILTGSVIYVFSLWTLINVQMHPFFLNPLITFPLLILGIEKIIRERKPALYISALTITALSNFYFLYMHVILIILYVLIRLFMKFGKDFRQIGKTIVPIIGYSLTGALLSGIVVLPTLYTFLIDTRTGGSGTALMYPLSYYSQLPGLFVNTSRPYWTAIGAASILLVSAVIVFLKQKENRMLCVFYILCLVFLLLPVFGSLFNGLGYPTNRWVWAYLLLGCYSLVHVWPYLFGLTKKEKTAILLFTAFYAVLCLVCRKSARMETYAGIGFMLLYLLALSYQPKQLVILSLVMINIVSNAVFVYVYPVRDYLERARRYSGVFRNVTVNDASVIRDLKNEEDDFFRYSGSGLRVNGNMIAGVSSTEYYWSLTNPNIVQFRNDTESREISTIMYEGDDARTALLALSAVRYYVRKAGSEAVIPYGYEYRDTAQKYEIYENTEPLPLTYSYDRYCLYEDWKKMNTADRQNILLEAAVLDEAPGQSFPQTKEAAQKAEELQYTITGFKGNGELKDNAFIIRKQNTEVTLKLDGEGNSETYLEILGLDIETKPGYDLYFDASFGSYSQEDWNALKPERQKFLKNLKKYYEKSSRVQIGFRTDTGVTSSVEYYADNDKKYADRHDFMINLGYGGRGIKEITLTFPMLGIYHFDAVRVYENPMDSYTQEIEHLKEDVLKNVDIGQDEITGNIDLTSPKILCFSIPYSKGWSAYVNGEKKELFRTDVKYMGLPLEEGHYDIVLKYETPFMKAGMIASCIGAAIFLFLLLKKGRANES